MPPPGRLRCFHRLGPKIGTVLVCVVAWCWLWSQLEPGLGRTYSPDSIGYYLLGHNLVHGRGYAANYSRDFFAAPQWPLPSRAFPPFYPLVVGTTERLLGNGLAAGPLVNLALMALMLGVLAGLLRHGIDDRWPLLVGAFLVFFMRDEGFRAEVVAGRAIPLTMVLLLLFIVAAWRLLSTAGGGWRVAVWGGLVLAAMPLTRFDQLGFALAALAVLGWLDYRQRRRLGQPWLPRRTLLMAGVFVVALSPWGVRNSLRFGKPFASDNWPMMISTYASETHINYWIEGQAPPTVFTAPKLWFNQRLGYFKRNVEEVHRAAGLLFYLAPLAVLLGWRRFTLQVRLMIGLLALHTLATLGTLSLMPYADRRFFAPMHLWLWLMLALALAQVGRVRGRKLARVVCRTGLAWLICGWTAWGTSWAALGNTLRVGQIMPHTAEDLAQHWVPLGRAFAPWLRPTSLVALYGAEHFNHFTGHRAIWLPTNRDETAHFFAWLARWQVDYILFNEHEVQLRQVQPFVLARYAPLDRTLIDARAWLRAATATSANAITSPAPPR